ncbi:MAG: ankyrin repeat domain-containing protein, partial [archaeon]|nr:ankyrin repeat domain-containing protein [archaeon]
MKTSKEQMIQEALTSRILKEGWLNKRGGSVKTWKRRYFVIREHKCYYYKEQLTQKLAMRGVQPMGQVDFAVIASVDEVTAADIKGEKKGQEYFKLSVNTGRGFYLITAPSAEQKAQWMSAFREALALYKKNEDMWQARAEGTYDPFADPEKIRLRAISLSPPTPTSSAADLNDEDSEDDSSEEDIQPELPEELYAAGLTDESDAVEAMRAEELYKAVVSRRYPVVKALLGLRTGVTWCSADHGNRTALHVAAELRDRVALQLLLPHLTGSLHHITCDMAWTPLHYAALAGSSECFALLLQAGRAQVRAQDRDGRTPTYLALIAGHPKIVEQCLQADMEGGDSQWTAAHLAILRGDVPSYITEVSSTPRLFTNSFPFALTLMHFAACSGSVPLLQILADSNCFHIDCLDQFSKTPLHIAANAGRVPAIQFLLKQGARVVAIDSRQKTPLHFAAGRNSLEGCQALLEAGCAVGALDEYLFSAIHTAAAHGAAPELMALLVKKSLPDAANMQG